MSSDRPRTWRDVLGLRTCSHSRRRPKETPQERHARQAPQPLPRVRPRALTLLEIPASVYYPAQTQSWLLHGLPYEVRRQIYEEVLGGHLVTLCGCRDAWPTLSV